MDVTDIPLVGKVDHYKLPGELALPGSLDQQKNKKTQMLNSHKLILKQSEAVHKFL